MDDAHKVTPTGQATGSLAAPAGAIGSDVGWCCGIRNFRVQLPPDIDPNSPAFQKAMQACQSLSPLPGGGP